MGRLVAVSVVKPEAVAADPHGTKREAKVLGRIGSHDNVVSLYDYEINPDGSAQYMVFEYLSGGTLVGYLHRTGPLPLDGLLRLGRQLSRGLAHLHGRGLVHRDVSPDNIWLDERQVAHLGDFDSAVIVSDSDEMRPITTGAYASPEEHEGWSLDARSDLYSLGGVLYVAATGSGRPDRASLLRSLRPDLPSAFTDLVASMLSESPSDRPSHAGEVLRRLDEARHASNLDVLITAGEGDAVEFKASLHHPYGQLPVDLAKKVELGRLTADQAVREVQKGLRLAVTKTVAAFLNSAGGTLLIGVGDVGAVLRIEPGCRAAYCSPRSNGTSGRWPRHWTSRSR
jgi:serine/threonine protein kinase